MDTHGVPRAIGSLKMMFSMLLFRMLLRSFLEHEHLAAPPGFPLVA